MDENTNVRCQETTNIYKTFTWKFQYLFQHNWRLDSWLSFQTEVHRSRLKTTSTLVTIYLNESQLRTNIVRSEKEWTHVQIAGRRFQDARRYFLVNSSFVKSYDVGVLGHDREHALQGWPGWQIRIWLNLNFERIWTYEISLRCELTNLT